MLRSGLDAVPVVLAILATFVRRVVSKSTIHVNVDMGEGEEASNSAHEFHASDAVLYPLLVLLIGILTRRLLKHVIIPYTGILLVWGIIIGVLDSAVFDWEHIGSSIAIMKSMAPELFLLIFLPILIFASALSLDWHVFKKTFGQVLMLAGPGVAVGTILTAAFVRYALPYGWSWKESLLVGSILSATDPVAVVAILKEVGASKRLGQVIEGESLFNDGTAFVLFLIFKDMVKGESLPPGELVAHFCQLALGGPAVGIGFGLLLYFCLTKIYQDELSEITLTFISAYLCFFVAEELLHVSGVLAVVVLGLVQSAIGAYAISPKALHICICLSLASYQRPQPPPGKQQVWLSPDRVWDLVREMMEFIANTIVFVYAGTMIAAMIYSSTVDGETTDKVLQAEDWGWALLLYLVLIVIRAAVVLVLSPALMRIGYGMTWKDGVVMVWSGLRGAVGLALSLIVLLDDSIDYEFKNLTVFFVGVVAAMTILVQGSTMSGLLRLLGLSSVSPAKLDSLLTWFKEMEDIPNKTLSHVKHDDLLGDPDWETVQELSALNIAPLLPGKDRLRKALEQTEPSDPLRQTLQRIGSMKAKSTNILFQSEHHDSVTCEAFLSEARERLLQAVKAVYAEGFEKGYIELHGVVQLKESADKSLDDLHKPLSDWTTIEPAASLSNFHMMLSTFLQWIGLATLSLKIVFASLESGVMTIAAFVFAHREAQHGLQDLLDEVEMALEELQAEEAMESEVVVGGLLETHREELGNRKHGDSPMAGVLQLRKAGLQAALKESQEECSLAVKLLQTTKQAYPEVMRAIKTRASANTILMHKQRFIEQLSHAGLIEHKEFCELQHLIEMRTKALLYTPPKLELPQTKHLLSFCPLFSGLDLPTFEVAVWPLVKQEVVNNRQNVFQGGDSATTMYILVRGLASISCSDGGEPIRTHGVGSLVGLTEVVLDQPRGRTLRAETTLEVAKIAKADLLRLMGSYPQVNLRAWQIVAGSLAHAQTETLFNNRNYEELQMYFRRSTLQHVAPHEVLVVPNSAFAVVGLLCELATAGSRGPQLTAPCVLGSGSFQVDSKAGATVLHLPTDIGQSISATSRKVREAVLNRRSVIAPGIMPVPPTGGTLRRQSLVYRHTADHSARQDGSLRSSTGQKLSRFSSNMELLPSASLPSDVSHKGAPILATRSLQLPRNPLADAFGTSSRLQPQLSGAPSVPVVPEAEPLEEGVLEAAADVEAAEKAG